MPNTPNYALPYPVLADTADVPRDIQALATAIDGISALRPPVVTSLPGSPVDGQEVYYTADATNNIVWHLRYIAAAPGAQKWAVLGPAPLYAETLTSESTSSTTYTDLTTVGPTITAPLAGVYMVTVGARIQTSATAGNSGYMSYGLGATAAVDSAAAMCITPAAGSLVVGSARTSRSAAVAAGDAIRGKYRVAGGSAAATFSNRWITAQPVSVG